MKNIYLVGAGPGDPDLLTLKAVKILKKADVVLHDALISRRVFDFINKNATLINVGKRAGKKYPSQEAINHLIIAHALKGKTVVRLKGGDPFIFGRGYEELEYAKKYGLTVEVIPGISSALAVPAYQNIPLTHRGVSRGFRVLTATNSEGLLSEELTEASKSKDTVVILMGLNKIQAIVALFKKHHHKDWPIAIIQNGTLKSEKAVYGNLDNIIQKTKQQNLKPPAIIVVGEVVALGKKTQLKNNYLKHIGYER
jgi:uroporphyrin-III C-methyltransferase